MASHANSLSIPASSNPPSSRISTPAPPAIPEPPLRSLPIAYLPPRHPYNPALLPPGMDPSSVDFRAFYPYIPNEIKHRKRTTSAQLKVLENIFKRDTKPNAALRKELALQLDMPPRGVQVWFQNRRAKEKTKANKMSSGKTAKSASPSAGSSDDTEISPESHHGRRVSLDMSHAPAPSPVARMTLHLDTDSLSKSAWNRSPSRSPADGSFMSDDSHLLAIRRGSLPANVFPASGAQSFGVTPLDPLARRRSVDANANVRRLAFNPYANLARAKNNQAQALRFSVSSSYPQNDGRPLLPHRSTAPTEVPMLRHSSLDSRFSGNSDFLPSQYHAHRTSLPPYVMSTRSIPSPTPGPLPAPGFSFGVATPSSAHSDGNSPDSYLYHRDEQDLDDDASASYDGFSRFGSMASMTSESSNASATFSEVSSTSPGFDMSPDFQRRDSCSGQFSEMMSGLAVGSEEEGLRLTGPYSSPEHMTTSVPVDGSLLLQGRDGELNRTYPSPSPTASPSGSPHSPNAGNVTISRSSELTYALHTKSDHEQDISFEHSPTSSSSPSHQIGAYFYTPDGGFSTNEPSPAAPALDYADKFQFEERQQYQLTYPSSHSENYTGYADSTEAASVSMAIHGGDDSFLVYP